MTTQLKGIIPPMTTPFDAEGKVDEPAFRREVRYLLVAGVHGLAVGGSTGEGHTLSTDEIRRLTAVAVEEVKGRIPVITGIIANSTRLVVERGRAVRDLGVAALQVTPVYYLFTPSEQEMFDYYQAISSPFSRMETGGTDKAHALQNGTASPNTNRMLSARFNRDDKRHDHPADQVATCAVELHRAVGHGHPGKPPIPPSQVSAGRS